MLIISVIDMQNTLLWIVIESLIWVTTTIQYKIVSEDLKANVCFDLFFALIDYFL